MKTRNTTRITVALALTVCMATFDMHAQQATVSPSGNTFRGSISVPFELRSLHPEVEAVRIECRVMQPKQAWNEGIEWNPLPESPSTAMPFEDVVNPKTRSFETTLVTTFSATRATPFRPGEVWSYTCTTMLRHRNPEARIPEWSAAGSGPTFPDWAQVASGRTMVEGTFVLR